MTYGADFRPGARALPRHDTHVVPPVEEYEKWFEHHVVDAHRLVGRFGYNAAKIRRVVWLVENAETLKRACDLVGMSYPATTRMLQVMPAGLRGPKLTARWAGK